MLRAVHADTVARAPDIVTPPPDYRTAYGPAPFGLAASLDIVDIWEQHEYVGVYRLKRTTHALVIWHHRIRMPVDLYYFDSHYRPLSEVQHQIVTLSPDFLHHETDRDEALLFIAPPARAKYVQIDLGSGVVTPLTVLRPMIPHPDR